MKWALVFQSLRAKLVAVVLLTTLVALGVALAAMVAYDLRGYRQAWVGDLDTQAELLGLTTASALAFDDPKTATENLALLRLRPQVRAAAVYGRQGELFASYAASPAERSFPALPDLQGVQVGQRQMVVFKHIIEQGEVVGTVYLRADYPLMDRVRSYAGIALSVAAVAMLVALGLSFWLQRLVTRPVLAIGEVAREVVERHDYSRRAERLTDDEVGQLAESFNRMMAEIERHALENQQSLREIEREVGERRTAQQEVMRLNEELERRVRERTAQLEASNTELALATETAEKANRAKSDFLSSMSHELRTPLNAILGFGYLLGSQGDALPESKRAGFTQHIVKAGKHLLTLIDEILDLARIESSHLMLSLEPVGLDELLQECRSMIGPAADQQGIHLLLPAELGLQVVADRTRLKQVLLNLLSNAIKYNRPQGSVIVDCHGVAPNRVALTVRDTGRGLRDDQLAGLFQPFNRLGQEAGPVEGTGIGLVVTKRLVELMGGTIQVDSRLGEGSAFSVELPAAGTLPLPSRAPGEHPRVPSRPRENTAGTLLYVEDNPANLQLVREIVELRGDLTLIAAPDAQLGIELARAHRPQVILMDIHLPGLSGLDALAILRADPLTTEIPVIALTANAMARDQAQGLVAGFFRYITKPVNVAQLNEAIDAALSSLSSSVGAPSGAIRAQP